MSPFRVDSKVVPSEPCVNASKEDGSMCQRHPGRNEQREAHEHAAAERGCGRGPDDVHGDAGDVVSDNCEVVTR